MWKIDGWLCLIMLGILLAPWLYYVAVKLTVYAYFMAKKQFQEDYDGKEEKTQDSP